MWWLVLVQEEDRPGASTSSLFMNNATISAGLQQGFRLSTHRSAALLHVPTPFCRLVLWFDAVCCAVLCSWLCRVRTSAGEEFEFSVENVNGVLSPVEAEVNKH